MYVIILDYISKNAIRSINEVIGVIDLGDVSLIKAKIRTTTQLKQHGYNSFIPYGGGRGTRFPWYVCGDNPYWILRGKRNRLFEHTETGKQITAHLIPKTHPNPKDQQGLPSLMNKSTQEITFE